MTSRSSARSAGLLLFRWRSGRLEVLLAHPGGPFWAHRDAGAWGIPKGEIEAGEIPFAVARREFEEETGMHPSDDPNVYQALGEVRQKSGKVVAAWALEGDLDPATAHSNTFEMEWPPASRQRVVFPEVDRVAWCGLVEAQRRMNPAQVVFLERLCALAAN